MTEHSKELDIQDYLLHEPPFDEYKRKVAALAKKYNISHKRDIDWHNFVAEVEQLSHPELRESEDERIRRELKEAFEAYDIESSWNRIPIRSIFAWLEKQKPAEWSEVELEFRGEKVKVKRPFFRDDNGRGYSTTEQDEEVSWNALRAWCEKKGISLYDLYPKVEWSEEDEKKIHFLSRLIEFQVKDDEYCFGDGRLISKKEAIEMLRSLRPSWKPREEQMKEGSAEAKIYGYDDGSFELIASWLDMPKNSIYKDGQKVRIIIVKEDKK